MRFPAITVKAKAGAPFALVFGALLALAPATWGQAPPGPIHANPDAKPEKIPTAEEAKRTIHVRVNEVTAPVTVRNARGEMLLDVPRESFHIFDNGIEQTIEHFDLGASSLSIVLAVETSSHIEPMFPSVKQTGLVFTETVMAQTSEVAIVGYDDDVNLLRKFTTDPEDIEEVIKTLTMGTSGTRLYDAMSRGISLLEKRPSVQRRILVVIGEAQDSGSESRLGEVLRQAQLANVTIYSIGLSTAMADLRAKKDPVDHSLGPPGTYPLPTPGGQPQTPGLERQVANPPIDYTALAIWLVKTGRNAVGPNSLAIASKATGGMFLNAKRDSTIQKAVDAIGGEIHAQYSLGYRPGGEVASGYHEIKVTVDRPGVSVRTRPGYYLPPPPGD
ncbi:MAG TPA: VWA domain-containing protein [Candidatus Acidoferrales bacterium]|jgi:VWFA-related protein|nr:VWA domain-containing protein [Candidatus Acidoferrales bacterium]